jgi:ATP-dependent exoDNAse (exonuclease V) beta subunit
MGSASTIFAPDEVYRRLAIDPRHSFMVQAPAGSGKTELLIQRFLCLLAIVDKPEAVVAITFTRKAAGEMLDRVLSALRCALDGEPPESPHEQFTFALASAALARDQACGWDLLANPGRLRVQTIDSLCTAIVGQMPWLARLGSMPRIEEQPRPLYDEAARRTVLMVEENSSFQVSLETLLLHLDNNAGRVQQLLATMLATRDQWIEMAVETGDTEREHLEESLSRALSEGLRTVDGLVPDDTRGSWLDLADYVAGNMTGEPDYPALACLGMTAWPGTTPDQHSVWLGLASVVLTKEDWRKKGGLNKNCGFPAENKARKEECASLIGRLQQVHGLLEALEFVRVLPPPSYTDAQWKIMRSLLECLKLAVAQLRMVFREEGGVDFCEVGLAARDALGRADDPADLALKLDARIEHLLVDEFQDTSLSQFELLSKLTAGWESEDARTLFLVGDPMQSIYRFRQAEVSLFLEARARGIGEIHPECLQLTANYRSLSSIVDRVNAMFSAIFPATDDVATGAIAYSPSQAPITETTGSAVTLHAFREGQDQLEADTVVEIVKDAHQQYQADSVAILVRARSHLPAIVEALKSAGLKFRAVEIDPLGERTVVRDLLALTRAILHVGDRISWLAILRAPWCGLTLTDLHVLASGDAHQTIWQRLQKLEDLTEDGRQRAERLRSVLAEAFEERGRWPLRRWVERVWTKLGGPACLTEQGSLQDASDYFDLLEAEQAGCDLADFDGFSERVEELYAQPDTQAEDWLQVMTIHKAKGLQFDTVILPGLGRPGRNDDSRLFLFHQWMRPDGTLERLLAPIKEVGSNDDPSYKYLQEIENRKGRHERVRQLYVAATRAKKHLHLLGHAKVNAAGELKPDGRSMLSDLWPALTPAEMELFHTRVADAPTVASSQVLAPDVVRRLPSAWSLPPIPSRVQWECSGAPPLELHDPTFEWVGDSLRHAGTVVHIFFRRMARGGYDTPNLAAIKSALAHVGVALAEIDSIAERVEDALQRTVSSDRGRWVLADYADARCEYPITGVLDGKIVRGIIDRTFVDKDGIRWIIDYKTSAHQGGGLIEFLNDQQRRYQDQLERYARLLAPLGRPIRLGLYFPLLNEWREWGVGETA